MPATDSSDGPRTIALVLAFVVTAPALVGCITGDSDGEGSLTQTGSSTVLPLAQRWSERFPGASVDVSGGGSSNGLNALLEGEADLGDASRKITPGDYADAGCQVSQEEIEQAQSGEHPWTYPECNGVQPTEWVVAYDVLTVVSHPDAGWLDQGVNYTQLRAIFTTDGTAETWSEVPGLDDAPDAEVRIFAPDQASGTYEFFFEEVAGNTGASLLAQGSDRYSPSSDDNVILNAISGTENSVGFFGLAYYIENEDAVKAVPVAAEGGNDPVRPSFETAGDYPLTRPLHLYTDGIPAGNATDRSPVNAYLQFILSERGQTIVPDVGYVKVADFSPSIHDAQTAALG